MRAVVSVCALLVAAACGERPPAGQDYYDRVIQPMLTASCASGTSGCHVADPGDPYRFAAGNLDLTSYENLRKRPDLLRAYGAYPVPLLLIKAAGATDELLIPYRDQFLPIEIEHAGGAVFAVGSPAFLALQRWLENGATRDGLPPPPDPVAGQGACSTALPPDFDAAALRATPEWQAHAGELDAVLGVLERKGCSASNCHGAPQADFYVTCGADEDQRAFDFRQVWAFVDDPVADSEILRRPLAPTAGGVPHAGGVHFTGPDDPDYLTLRAFAEGVGPLDFGAGDPGKQFFAGEVMPVLLRRGCAAEGCHSPAAMNDFKLRAGAQGFMSALALEKNYDLAKREFLAFEVPDVRRGRLVAKGLLPVNGGIAHRGGPVLETPFAGGADPAACPPVYDPAGPAFCALVEWGRIEREALLAAGAIDRLGAGDTVAIVYVDRPAGDVTTRLEFAEYRPGSDLRVARATLDERGALVAVAAPVSLLDGCAGAGDRGAVDVRAPEVKNDGETVAFAMRTSAGEGLAIWTVRTDGTGCARLTGPGAAHDFDPSWSPDGEWIVYASTAAGGVTPRDGRPQSDLWRVRADGGGAERITFLSSSEVGPAFMREGRITMTTEKYDAAGGTGFYQLAGRRLNWDLTDYHPLLAQRASSPYADAGDPAATRPSFGYAQATDIREGFDGNFLCILSDEGARAAAGTVGIFNRSVGPMELGRGDPGYLRSLSIPDPAATGRGATQGAYRAPFPLLDGRILVAWAGGAFDLGSVGALDFDLYALDPRTGERELLLGGSGAQVDAVLALRHPPRKLYDNRRQLVFGGYQDLTAPEHAVVHVTDAPMLATLLGANLRRGRPVGRFRDADRVVVLDAGGQPLGSAPLAADGSVRLRVPAATPVYLQVAGGTETFTMSEEHQFGPGEHISLGVPEPLFDHVCGGCHGSVSGQEIDVSVTPDVLTGASASASASAPPVPVGQ